MIITELFKTREDGVNLYKTYSDANCFVQKEGTNELYVEAIDVEGAPYTYIETEKPIPEKFVTYRRVKPAEVTDNGTENN